MRRNRAGDASVRHQGRLGQQGSVQRNGLLRSTSATLLMITVACVVIWSIYTLTSSKDLDQASGQGMVDVEIADDIGERQSSGETVSTLDGEDPGAWTGRRGEPFRKLNMLGFLKTAPAAKDGWKKCRTYREIDLAPHKTSQEHGHDKEMRRVMPKAGVSWEFSISEDKEAEWLGLHSWDDRYQYGSAEADARVKEAGYCRIHMPSVPRTGSTWFRAMFETATSQPSFSMWPEGGTKKTKYMAFSSDEPCGASLDHMEGVLHSKRVFPCRDLRPPKDDSPILFKSHTPFFPSYNKPSLMPESTCMLLLLVRNPIDSYDAWDRYNLRQNVPVIRDYMPLWEGHLAHWIAAAGDIPIYVFRYEDMLANPENVLRDVLQTLPGKWNWSDESIAKAMRLFGPKKTFEEKCGSGFKSSSLAEVEIVRRHYGDFLRHFGYRFTKK